MKKDRDGGKFVGGKGGMGVAQRLINQIPPHEVLIEPFAGEAVIACTIRPAAEVILVDKVRQPGLAIPATHRKVTTFLQGDGIAYLRERKYSGKEFVYGDPPYLLSARADRGRHYYEHEWPDAMHRRFLAVALAINARVMISGYRSPMYDDALAEWRRIEFQVQTRGGGQATEVIWMNYPQPTELHDYRFVGENFRERQRLRKKIRRAVLDLLRMPILERRALFAELRAAMADPVGGAMRAGGLSEVVIDIAAPEVARLPAAGFGATAARGAVLAQTREDRAL